MPSTAPQQPPASGSTSKMFGGSFLPSNPFDIPETRDLVESKIASGEITRGDVEIMEKGYRWMIYTPPATAVAFSALVWQLMKKQYPRPRLITRMFWGTLALGSGGLLGFGAAGMAASMEVNDKIQDGERKAEIFDEITSLSRRIREEAAAPSILGSDPNVLQIPATSAAAVGPKKPYSSNVIPGSSRLPRDFEFPTERQGGEDLLIGSEILKKETRSTWGYVKSWIPGMKKD
ncbi:hypothetical protein IAR55_001404 [Kwoniella newhampshirensis]|uniref:Uncharacterized protein n=1 Tax=Kwoniella newhampshirensis TaxID=1651941 RepID=A0AAW0Z225_9TREE